MVLAQKIEIRAELVLGWSSLTAVVNVRPGHGRYARKAVCPLLRCIIDRGEGPSLFFGEAATIMVLQKWRDAGVTDGDLGIYDHCGKMISNRVDIVPDSEDVLHRKKHDVLGVFNTIDHAIILILDQVEENQ